MERCRLCYSDTDPELCQNIFDTKLDPPPWTTVRQLTNLMVMENDPFTKILCVECFVQLKKINAFRQKMLVTDYRIRHEIKQLSKWTNDDFNQFIVRLTRIDDYLVKEEVIEIDESENETDNYGISSNKSACNGIVDNAVDIINHNQNGRIHTEDIIDHFNINDNNNNNNSEGYNDNNSTIPNNNNDDENANGKIYTDNVGEINGNCTENRIRIVEVTSSKKLPHECVQCNKSFQFLNHLKLHNFKVHSNNNRELKRRIICRKKRKDGRNQCDKCNRTFLQRNYLNMHLKVHQKEGNHCNTTESEASRSDRDNVEDHTVDDDIPAEEDSSKVNDNNFSTTSPTTTNSHDCILKENPTEINENCPEFENQSEVTTTTTTEFLDRNHNPINNDTISNNKEITTNTDNVENIDRNCVNNKNTQHQCVECNKTFVHINHLKLHNFKVHKKQKLSKNTNNYKQTNTQSFGSFGNQTKLGRRRRRPTNGRNKCNKCNRTFLYRNYLNLHLKVHKNEADREYDDNVEESNYYEIANIKDEREQSFDNTNNNCDNTDISIMINSDDYIVAKEEIEINENPIKIEIETDESCNISINNNDDDDDDVEPVDDDNQNNHNITKELTIDLHRIDDIYRDNNINQMNVDRSIGDQIDYISNEDNSCNNKTMLDEDVMIENRHNELDINDNNESYSDNNRIEAVIRDIDGNGKTTIANVDDNCSQIVVGSEIIDYKERQHRCVQCNKTFVFLNHLKLHNFKKHNNPNAHQEQINKIDSFRVFKNQFGLKRKRKNGQFKCDKCNKIFGQRNYLNLHLKVHQKEASGSDRDNQQQQCDNVNDKSSVENNNYKIVPIEDDGEIFESTNNKNDFSDVHSLVMANSDDYILEEVVEGNGNTSKTDNECIDDNQNCISTTEQFTTYLDRFDNSEEEELHNSLNNQKNHKHSSTNGNQAVIVEYIETFESQFNITKIGEDGREEVDSKTRSNTIALQESCKDSEFQNKQYDNLKYYSVYHNDHTYSTLSNVQEEQLSTNTSNNYDDVTTKQSMIKSHSDDYISKDKKCLKFESVDDNQNTVSITEEFINQNDNNLTSDNSTCDNDDKRSNTDGDILKEKLIKIDGNRLNFENESVDKDTTTTKEEFYIALHRNDDKDLETNDKHCTTLTGDSTEIVRNGTIQAPEIHLDINDNKKTCIDDDGNCKTVIKKISSKNGQHECVQCNKSFQFLNHLKLHNFKVHRNKSPLNQVIIEPNTTETFKKCENQVKITIRCKDGRYSCHEFNTTFPSNNNNSNVQTNEETHSESINDDDDVKTDNDNIAELNSKYHSCEICHKILSTKHSLNAHLRIHTGEKPYQCVICNKRFRYNSTLRAHERIHNNNRQYCCDICGKMFLGSGTLKKHVRIHTGDKPYGCNKCGMRFTQSGTLQKHLKRELGETSYECLQCERKFTVKNNLLHHMRVHTGERPYQCQICRKQFRQFTTLKEHEVLHSGERPFQCHLCASSFAVKRTLKKHLRVHTGEKLYHCEICDKRFTQNSNLRRHYRRIHFDETS